MSFSNDKRQGDRTSGSQRIENDRNQVQRRKYFRVCYPPAAVVPKITNLLTAKVIDISVKAVKFVLPASGANFIADDKINITLEFRDGLNIDTIGTLCRQESDPTNRKVLVYIFNDEIPAAVINKEQAYLLKNFPDFCREKFRTDFLREKSDH